jgi:hypothetical protein
MNKRDFCIVLFELSPVVFVVANLSEGCGVNIIDNCFQLTWVAKSDYFDCHERQSLYTVKSCWTHQPQFCGILTHNRDATCFRELAPLCLITYKLWFTFYVRNCVVSFWSISFKHLIYFIGCRNEVNWLWSEGSVNNPGSSDRALWHVSEL